VAFAITYKASAERELAGLSQRLRRRVRREVQKLLPDPRRPIDVEAEEMVWGDWEGYSRLVVGEYRVIYEIDDRAERVRPPRATQHEVEVEPARRAGVTVGGLSGSPEGRTPRDSSLRP
jgi:mRNA-degrading endonuclease RelE of RelBE toxin-antitoxin system